MSSLKEAVKEYVEARDELEDAQKPNGGFGQPTRLSHGDPRILRHRLARTNLNFAAGLCACGAVDAEKCPGMCPPVPRETPVPVHPVFIFAGSAMQARVAAQTLGLRPSEYMRVVGTESIAGVRGGTMYLYGTYSEYPRAHEVVATAKHYGFTVKEISRETI